MTNATVAQHFDLAIQVEAYMERLYHTLADKFAATPTVADFWRRLAEQEQMHALQLQVIRNNLSPEELRQESKAPALGYEKVLERPIESRLALVKDLDDAFAVAVELETPETNALFSFLIKHFSHDLQVEHLLLEALQQHIEQLADFARFFGISDNRRRIKAQ